MFGCWYPDVVNIIARRHTGVMSNFMPQTYCLNHHPGLGKIDILKGCFGQEDPVFSEIIFLA